MFRALSATSRSRKLRRFYDLFRPTANDRVLDIGGECDPTGSSVQLCDSYRWKCRLTVLNLDRSALHLIKESYPEVITVAGDARRLPFADKSFDIIFSNAVIEHLYTWDNQEAMAREIQRVGKRWFVATPNRWYPFEFHSRLPLVSWFPTPLRCRLTRLLCWNHVSRRYVTGIRMDEVRLLARREMRTLFPGSLIVPVRVTFYPETLIALGPASLVQM